MAGSKNENIKSEALKSDVLKVGHHGSRYSSTDEFLTKVFPKVAVIQVGKNMYGHPSKETLRRLKNVGAAVYRNDTSDTWSRLYWGTGLVFSSTHCSADSLDRKSVV